MINSKICINAGKGRRKKTGEIICGSCDICVSCGAVWCTRWLVYEENCIVKCQAEWGKNAAADEKICAQWKYTFDVAHANTPNHRAEPHFIHYNIFTSHFSSSNPFKHSLWVKDSHYFCHSTRRQHIHLRPRILSSNSDSKNVQHIFVDLHSQAHDSIPFVFLFNFIIHTWISMFSYV